MAKHLSLTEIKKRLLIGGPENFMRRFVANDNGAVKRFIDASVVPLWTQQDDGDTSWIDGGDVVTDVPIGQGNQLTANLLTKEASIAINDPDWHVVAQKEVQDPQTGETTIQDDPTSAQIARAYLRSEWKMKNWTRIARRALQKNNMTGLGVLRYYWDKDGCQYEHVQSWDLAIDPFVKDFQKLKFGGVRLRRTLRDAVEEWPNGKFKDKIGSAKENADTERIDVWLYYDNGTEASVYDDQLLVSKRAAKQDDNLANPYGRVPLHILEGDIYPGRSPFPLGDSVLAAGAQAELSDLNLYISNIAKHGGPRNFADAGLDPSAKDNLEKGEQQGVIFVKGLDPQRPPLLRIPGERLEPAVLEAKQEARNELDSITGVNQYDRGVLTDKPKFATEVAVSASRSGVRGSQAKITYEKYVSRMAEICIELTVKFGGPHVTDEGEQVASFEHQTLWEALKNVTEVYVIEGSTTFKDPAMEQQQSMQLATMTTQAYPLMMQLAMTGVMRQIPDLQKIWDRVYRAFGVNNTEQMWIEAPQQGGGQQGKPPIENINYKDAPPDIRRQMEQQAGLQPSQMETQSPAQLAAAPQVPAGPDTLAHHVDLVKQARDHQHETRLEMLRMMHEQALKQADIQINDQKAKQVASNGKGK